MSPPRKRKRTQPPNPSSSSSSVINPLSHTPHTLKQFTLAGLHHDSPLLSELYPGFPHRPPRPARRRPFTPHGGSDPSNLTDKSGDEGGDELTNFTTDADDDDGPIGARTTAGEESDLGSNSSPSTSTPRQLRKKDSRKEREKDRKALAYTSKVGVLINTIKRSLAENDIPLAKRAFALLVRSKVNGRKVDLRHERLWELGAEIILREGEPPPFTPPNPNPGSGDQEGEFKTAFQLELERQQQQEETEGDDKLERELREKDQQLERQQQNLARLKSYYQYLIQNHPFSKQHPHSTGRPLLEFSVAMFSAEMEGLYALHRRLLERVSEREARGEFDDVEGEMMDGIEEEPSGFDSSGEGDGFGMDVDMIDSSEKPPQNSKEARVIAEKDELRREILQKMKGVAERMDTLLETVPYSRDGEFIRLRAMVGLYIADLSVPYDEKEKKRGQKAGEKERQKARKLLEDVKDTGKGVLREDDEALLRGLGSEDEMSDDEGEGGEESEEEEETILPMFSSVPV